MFRLWGKKKKPLNLMVHQSGMKYQLNLCIARGFGREVIIVKSEIRVVS